MPTSSGPPENFSRNRLALGLTWLLLALSSIVLVEPAPYDILAVALCAAFFVTGLRVPPGLGGALALMALFALANVVSGVFSPEPETSIRYMLVTFFLILTWIFFTSLIYDDPKRMLEVIWSGYTVAALIAVVLGLTGYFRMIPGYERFLYEGRASGAFKDANVFGPFLVPVALHLVTKLERGWRIGQLAVLALFLFLVFGILLSFSRAAWGNLVVSGLVYFFLRLGTARSSEQVAKLLAIGGAVLGGGTLFVLWSISVPDVSALFNERAMLFQDYDVGTGGRFSSLAAALQESLRNPLGIGPGRSAAVFTPEPHNLYVHILVETGWLGGIAFVVFLLLTLWRGLRFCLQNSPVQQAYIMIFAAVVGTLAGNIVIHGTHWRHLYLLLAMLWGPMLAFQAHGIRPLHRT